MSIILSRQYVVARFILDNEVYTLIFNPLKVVFQDNNGSIHLEILKEQVERFCKIGVNLDDKPRLSVASAFIFPGRTRINETW